MHQVQPLKEKIAKFECIRIANIINGHKVSIGKDSKALEADGGNGCTTMWTDFMPQNCTLKHGKNDQFYAPHILAQLHKILKHY